MDTFFSNIFKISDDEVFTVSQYSQRSSEWFNERKNRLTASNFGAALDRNPYCSSDALLVQLLYKSFSGNAATQYGTTNEPIACNQYLDDIEMMGKTTRPSCPDKLHGNSRLVEQENIVETHLLEEQPNDVQEREPAEPEQRGANLDCCYQSEPKMNQRTSNVTYRECGLKISKKYPFLAASPDGIIEANYPVCTVCSGYRCGYDGSLENQHQIDVNLNCEFNPKYDLIDYSFDLATGKVSQTPMWHCDQPVPHRFLLEIKCPFRQRLYGKIPIHYYCQILGSMHILDLPYTHFYVWTPKKTSLQCFPRNDDLWNQEILPGLLNFYFDRYAPLLFLQWKNNLDVSDKNGPNTNWLIPKPDVDCEYVRMVYKTCKSYKTVF